MSTKTQLKTFSFKGEYHAFSAKGGSEVGSHFQRTLGILKIVPPVVRPDQYLGLFFSDSILLNQFWQQRAETESRFQKIAILASRRIKIFLRNLCWINRFWFQKVYPLIQGCFEGNFENSKNSQQNFFLKETLQKMKIFIISIGIEKFQKGDFLLFSCVNIHFRFKK